MFYVSDPVLSQEKVTQRGSFCYCYSLVSGLSSLHYRERVQSRRLANFLGGEKKDRKFKLGRDIEIIIEKKSSQ